MMRSIEEEKERDRSKSQEGSQNDSVSGEKQKSSVEKLNMADLNEQHKKLKDKIEASQQKVLEEGLRRKRKSSYGDQRLEIRKSINNLELKPDVSLDG